MVQIKREQLIRKINNIKLSNSGKFFALPVLEMALFEIKDNRLIIKSTDLETSSEESIEIENQKPAKATIQINPLRNFIETIEGKYVKVYFGKNKVKVKIRNQKIILTSTDPKEFPDLPKITKYKKIIVDIKRFQRCLTEIRSSIDNKTYKPELASTYLHSDKNGLYLVGTDSYRLCEKKVTDYLDEVKTLIPLTTINKLVRFNSLNPLMSILIGENLIVFKSGKSKLTSRITEGEYPDYRKIFPDKFTEIIEINRKKLLNVLKFMVSYNNDLKLIIENNLVRIESSNDKISSNFKIKSKTLKSGKGVEVVLNSKYFLDSIFCSLQKNIRIKIKDSDSPILISHNKNTRYLIMPIKN